MFEYMEHDMAGLLESGLVTLDPEQVRSLMKQLMQVRRFARCPCYYGLWQRRLEAATKS